MTDIGFVIAPVVRLLAAAALRPSGVGASGAD
jgi:hypothetical protein